VLALIPLFPLVGFVTNALIGRRLPKSMSGGLASLVMVASFVVSASAVWQLAGLPVESRVKRKHACDVSMANIAGSSFAPHRSGMSRAVWSDGMGRLPTSKI